MSATGVEGKTPEAAADTRSAAIESSAKSFDALDLNSVSSSEPGNDSDSDADSDTCDRDDFALSIAAESVSCMPEMHSGALLSVSEYLLQGL